MCRVLVVEIRIFEIPAVTCTVSNKSKSNKERVIAVNLSICQYKYKKYQAITVKALDAFILCYSVYSLRECIF